MSDVPSNLVPVRTSGLPIAPEASGEMYIVVTYQGTTYRVRADDLVQVIGVLPSRAVLAGTGLTGGGQLSADVTLSIAVGGVNSTLMSSTGATPGTYGSTTQVPVITVDAAGRITAVSQVSVSAGGGDGNVVGPNSSTPGAIVRWQSSDGRNLSNNSPAVSVSEGGTGKDTLDPYLLMFGGTTGTGPIQQAASAGALNQVLSSNGPGALPTWRNAGGDVVGPGSSTDNAVPRFDGTTGKTLQMSLVTISDTGAVTGVLSLDIGSTDTTLTRASAGDVNIEGNIIYRAGGTDVPVTDGGTGASDASGARTNLGATTLGSNFFTVTNPSAVTYPRANADNTLSMQTAAATAKDLIDPLSAAGALTGSESLTVVQSGTAVKTTVQAVANLSPPTDIQEFTTPGAFTWVKRDGAKLVQVIAIGGGGGGGSGGRGIGGSSYGAGGGGGGAYRNEWYEAADLAATVTGTVGAGGQGGAADTTTTRAGIAGTPGGASSFGSLLTAYGGGGGAGGGITNPGGGGGSGAGAASAGVNPVTSGAAAIAGAMGGAAGGTSAAAGSVTNAIGGAGGGGTSLNTVGSAAGDSIGGGPGGGAGGAGLTARAGTAGGRSTANTTAPAGGIAGTSTTSGGDGQSGSTANPWMPGSGGGGGGSTTGDATALNGGIGGAGGRGAGGGGGGDCNHTNAGTRSGAGGDGGDGIVVVITYF